MSTKNIIEIILDVISVVKSFLSSIPGKKFIELSQNPAPVPSKLIA